MPHKLDDALLITPSLQERLCDEASFESGRPNMTWWCGAERSNGQFVGFSYGYLPEFHEKVLAEQMVRALNKECGHGGAWVVQWTDHGTRFVMLWLDADGDVQFAVEAGEDAIGLLETRLLHWVAQAEDAWLLWHKHMRETLAPSDDQLFKKAQGQRRPSVH